MMEILEQEFNSKKKEAETNVIIVPKIEDFIVIDENENISQSKTLKHWKDPINKSEKAESEQKILEIEEKIFPDVVVLRIVKEKISKDGPDSLTEEEKQQLESLENEFNAQKKQAEDQGILPKLDDYIEDNKKDEQPNFACCSCEKN